MIRMKKIGICLWTKIRIYSNKDGVYERRLDWLCTAVSVVVAWALFVVLNWYYSVCPLSHLKQQPGATVGELLQITKFSQGATRFISKEGQETAPAQLLDNFFFLSGDVTRLAGDSADDKVPVLNDKVLKQVHDLILAELNQGRAANEGEPASKKDAPAPANPKNRLVRQVTLILEFLRLKNVVLNLSDGKGRHERESLELAEKTLLAFADPFGSEQKFADDTVNAEGQLKLVRNSLKNEVEVPKAGDAWPETLKKAHEGFYRDVQRLIPGEPNPHLRLAGAQAYGRGPVFTILYINNSAYALGIEVRALYAGQRFAVEARYLLVELSKAASPIGSSRTLTVPVLKRAPWYCGFRPISVQISEEQLASRFFDECKAIARGAGVKLQSVRLEPSTEELKAQYVNSIRYALESRLGGEAKEKIAVQLPGDLAKTVAPMPAKTLDEVIVWPRRFNGGTSWGVIQFFVVALTCRFFIGFFLISSWISSVRPDAPVPCWYVRLWRWLRGVKPRSGRQTSHLLPRELSDTAKRMELQQKLKIFTAAELEPMKSMIEELSERVNNRLTSLRFIISALPLVGFLGTVAGLSNSLIGASGISSDSLVERQSALQAMQIALGTAFDKSFLAFVATILCLGGWFRLMRSLGQLRTNWLVSAEKMEDLASQEASWSPPPSGQAEK